METQESKILSAFEKYKGFSSNIFDNEDWRECDAFGAGVEFALKIAAEKAEIEINNDCYGISIAKGTRTTEREQGFSSTTNISVYKNSILDCLK